MDDGFVEVGYQICDLGHQHFPATHLLHGHDAGRCHERVRQRRLACATHACKQASREAV
jgi:hypothetical protein